jgi:DNA replication ATP-dependent helicase Dna2
LLWTSAWDEILEPNEPSVAFVYEDHAWSSQWNRFEADAVASLVWRLRDRMQAELSNQVDPPTGQLKPAQAPRPITDDEFWTTGVGVVTPHRAQQALVVSALKKAFPATDPELIRDAVDTVERFQGQERDVIIATFALGDPDAISDEDEFLLAFNRFNVVASRARAKLIALVSEQVIDHLSEDIEVLRESRLLKLYANSFCDKERPMTLGHLPNGQQQDVRGAFRSH